MAKELNPDLFGEKSSSLQNRPSAGQSHQMAGFRGLRTQSSSSGAGDSILDVDKQLFELRSQNAMMVEQMNKISAAFNESQKALSGRIDRQQQSLQKLETAGQGLSTEVQQKLQILAQKLHERRSFDHKIQEMIDRHNSVIKTYEVRLNQMQKMLQEKEQQAAMAAAALNDVKMELARLKRL